MKLFIIIITISLGLLESQVLETNTDLNKIIQCRICQEMFAIDFNIDQFLKDKVNVVKTNIQSNFPNRITEVTNLLSNDNLQFMTQEISMQYFFKGAENQIDDNYTSQLKQCKMKQTGLDRNCDNLKLNICELILSFKAGFCSAFPKVTEAVNMPVPNTNILQQLQNQIDPINKMMKNMNSGQSNPENISLIELSPSYIESNFDSKPKTHWTPPKPVLLENFEKSMGDQLKEISFLTTEIAKYEKKLKQYKQELANKLETFQSSYKVIQKTISEITKLVNQPSLSEFIKSPSQFTEDDWDENSKSKFLNN